MDEITLQFSLAEGSDGDDHQRRPSVPVEVVLHGSNVAICISGASGHSVSEVHVEHYEGQIVARVWDQHGMEIGGDPVSTIVMLEDSTAR